MNMLSRTFSKLGASLVLALGLSACGGGDAEPPPNEVALTGPSVVITDSEPGATATGDVTFTFAFSTDVGSSFTADDVVLSGGTKGAFAMASGGRSATLVAVPLPNSSGSLVVAVAAGTFENANGTKNVLSAVASQGYSTVPAGTKTQMSLPVSFDSPSVDYGLIGFGGAEDSTVAVDPTNAANNVAKVVRAAGAESFAGTTITAPAGLGFSPKVPFTATDTKISVRVWSPDAGIPVRMKIEDHTDSNKSVETQTTTTVAGSWQTLTFDFKNNVSGTPALNLGYTYDKATIFFDFGRDPASAVTKSYYFDDVTFVPGGGVVPPPSTGTLLLSFDETPPAFSDMGAYGGALPTVEPGPTGGTGNALKILKPVSPDTWGGTFFTVARIPFTADRTSITARVYSTLAGAKIRMKVEVPGGASVEVTGTTVATANTWTTVTWDFGAVDITKAYTIIAITPDADRVTDGKTYTIDDITLAPAGAVVPPPVPGAVFVSFDETPPAFTDMGAYGGALPTVEAGPTGGTGNALKILKPVSPDTWGGVFFTTAKIPFTATAKKITARVYSSRAGAAITFKVEVPGGVSTEVTAAPTGAANTWSTVTWDFSAVDLSKSYKIMAITPDVARVTDGQTYYIDQITVVEGGGSGGTPVTIASLDEPGAVLTGFEGCWDSFVVADPAGGAGTNMVGKVTKPGSGVPFYCGSTVVTVKNGGFTPIAFTASAQTMTVRVWSPDAGKPVRLKVEDIADASKYVETDTLTTVAGGWQTMTFNFANPATGSPALNLATTYNKVSIFFDFGTIGSGKTYYFDDVTFVTGTGTNTAVATFDERNFDNTQSQPSILTGFGGAENSTLVGLSDGLPAGGGTGKAAKVVKNAGEVWAGTSIQRKTNDAVPTIPFATGATKMTVRVYSAYAGVRVHLKVEQSGRPDYNSEVAACTTKVNEWETLTFDFGPAGLHFVPTGPCPGGYQTDPTKTPYLPTAQLDVTKTYNKVNIFFDYGLGDAGYDAMPGTRTYYFDDVKFIGN